VPVPLSDDRSLVLSLPPGFWLRAPRNLAPASSLAGDGLIAHYLNERGGSVSMLHAGSVPLPASDGADTVEARGDPRAEAAAADFAAALGTHYARVGWRLEGDAPVLSPATLTVDGRKSPAWRTARYRTRPLDYAGPESVFTAECVLFRPAGTDVLAYVALDAKAGGTTLDRALAGLRVAALRDAAAKGRRVQLDDLAEALDPTRYPVRLLAFELPPGFTPTLTTWRGGGRPLFEEERLGAGSEAPSFLRMTQAHADPKRTLEQDCLDVRAAWAPELLGPNEEVPLLTRGHRALLFSHPAAGERPEARAHTAVLRLDDQTLSVTWVSRGGAAQAERDLAELRAVLRSVELAVRW
jgi:hypothetical protein